jgi:hypothetical protein
MGNNTTKSIRKTLANALDKAMSGNLSYEDGRNVIGLANQISHNMAVEVKVLTMKERMGHQVDVFGELSVD